MQARGRGAAKPPIGIAFDGDLGNRIDALLAVGMLNGLTAKTEARRITLSVSRSSLKAAQLADVVSSFYAGRPAGSSTGGIGAAREGMIGVPEGGPPDDAPPFAAAIARKTPEGSAVYHSSIGGWLDTAETSVLIRNLMLAQNDENAAIVMAGPATGVVKMLALYRAVPQITAKIRALVVAIGAFPTGAVDPSVKIDIASARKLFAEWPTPIVAVGSEVGAALPYPGSSIASDFSWATDHPVVDAYKAFKPMPYDAPASALAATLYAVHPEETYFKLSDPGTISVTETGQTTFTPKADGKHRYLIVDPAQKDRVIKVYTELVSSQPAPRPGRGGRGAAAAAAQQAPAQQPPQQQQQQAPAPTPPAAPAVPNPAAP